MPFLRNITSGLRSLFQKEQVDRELDEELRAYQEMATEEKLKQGMNPTLPFALRAWSEEASKSPRKSFALAAGNSSWRPAGRICASPAERYASPPDSRLSPSSRSLSASVPTPRFLAS